MKTSAIRSLLGCDVTGSVAGIRRTQYFRLHARVGRAGKELAGDKANIYTATNALQDPHRVEARPSLIARARSADLVGVHRRAARDRLAAAGANAGRQSENPGRAARLFRGGALRHDAGRADRRSTARRATYIPAAIRTSISIRAISRRSPPRLANAWRSSIPPDADGYRARTKAFLERWQQAIARWETDRRRR